MGFDLSPTETTLVSSETLLINVAFFHLFSETLMCGWRARIRSLGNSCFQPLGSVPAQFGLLGHLCFSTLQDGLDRLALGSQLLPFHRQLGNVAFSPQKPWSHVCCSGSLNTNPEFQGRGGRLETCIPIHVPQQ